MLDEHLNAYTQDLLMKACARTHQGVIFKSESLPKPTFDMVSAEEVSQSVQQQIATTIDSSIAALNTKLNASIKTHVEGFLRTKFGPLMADFMFKDKASTSDSMAPIDQISSKTDGAKAQQIGEGWSAHTAGRTAISPPVRPARWPVRPSITPVVRSDLRSV